MTKTEFLKGWKLLIMQSWGWRYNQIGRDHEPTPDALAQLDFYYEKLKWAHPKAWMKVADLFAQGKEWPSITDLRSALQSINPEFIPALPKPILHGEPMPDDVRAMISKIGQSMPKVTVG